MKTSPFLDEVRAEALGGVLLRFLKIRFGVEPTAEIRSRVKTEQNLDRLNRWIDAVAASDSLDEFLATFHQE